MNNAGSGVYAPFAESGRERELRQLRVNAEAVVDLMSRYLPGMVERGRGAIINMASTAGFQALPYNAGYSAANAHVLLLSEAVAAEVKGAGFRSPPSAQGRSRRSSRMQNDSGYFAERLLKFTFTEPERVARDSLAAAGRGRRSVIPGASSSAPRMARTDSCPGR